MTELTWYYAYLAAGSAHPGYPDFGPAKKIVRIKFKTDRAPAGSKLFYLKIFF